MVKKNDLDYDDADELKAFKGDKPGFGKKLLPEQIRAKFLAKTTPETRKRVEKMSIADFMIMYKSINKEDEEGDLGGSEEGEE